MKLMNKVALVLGKQRNNDNASLHIEFTSLYYLKWSLSELFLIELFSGKLYICFL